MKMCVLLCVYSYRSFNREDTVSLGRSEQEDCLEAHVGPHNVIFTLVNSLVSQGVAHSISISKTDFSVFQS